MTFCIAFDLAGSGLGGGVERGVTVAGLTPEVNAEVRQLLARNQKVEAVKRVREATRWGLKESKDNV